MTSSTDTQRSAWQRLRLRAGAAALHRWHRFLARRPADLMQALRYAYSADNTSLGLIPTERIPSRVTGFHDLSYLFACHRGNRGIIAQDFDEAAYLWKVVLDRQPKQILEIGRWLGGSTVLLCAASAQYGGSVISVDSKTMDPGSASDSAIATHLQQLGLDNYQLCVGDSGRFDPGTPVQMAFVDGDHSYRGVRADFENVISRLSAGGDLLFHDSCAARPFATVHEGPARLVREVRLGEDLTWVHEVGSISHFMVNR